MATYLEVRSAIVETLKTKLAPPADDMLSIKSHGGGFTAADLQQVATVTPAMRVSKLSAIIDQDNGQSYANVTWCIDVITTTKPQLPRDVAIEYFVYKVQQFLPLSNWDLDIDLPENIREQNVFSPALEMKGAAMYRITWEQRQSIDLEIDPGTLNDFLESHPQYKDEGDGGEIFMEDITEIQQ